MPNPQLELAHSFVRDTNRSMFLTGKAGTGKTTFLHGLKASLPKRMVVTAPTGVAAINAGGVTLHSFFQLPFGPFAPGSDIERQTAERRFNREKRDIIRSLDLLIIDEISMVRCDLLDAVDFVLRLHRGSDQPFGGVQLLMIGDLHQLAPVVPEQDWAILKDFYGSGYFFSSRALAATDVLSIALEHIYRQSDADFIELLNAVRESRLDETSLARLNARYRPDFQPRPDDGYITLTTHNRGADAINETRLEALGSRALRFHATVEGEYPAHSYPTAATLVLKQGAQVMFIRNDGEPDKRFFNGKIGAVTRLAHERIWVRCPGDPSDIEVEAATWENIRYGIDPETKAITEEVIGKFVQVPLRLAWAITIHKSQGLTFERAIIDAAAAFSPGQVYVALSRCKTLDGLVLSAPIPRRAVMTDQRVSHYVDEATSQPPTREQLESARIAYQQQLLLDCWNFDRLGARLRRLFGLLRANPNVIDLTGADAMDALQQQTLDGVVSVAAKFRRELQSKFRADQVPEDDPHLQERVRKASAYFAEQLGQGLRPWLAAFRCETDNKALRKTLVQAVADLRETALIKSAAVASCREGFSANTYLGDLAKAQLDDARLPPQTRSASSPDRTKGLLGALQQWRTQTAQREDAQGETRYRIITRAVLRQIAKARPDSPEALTRIKGIGTRTVERYGNEILAIVADHGRHKDSAAAAPNSAPIEPAPTPAPAKETKESTHQISYRLYQAGMSIAEIADERSLKPTTIEGHLAHFVASGDIAVTDFLGEEKLAEIVAVLNETGTDTLTPAKEKLGDRVSFGELRMVKAHLAQTASS